MKGLIGPVPSKLLMNGTCKTYSCWSKNLLKPCHILHRWGVSSTPWLGSHTKNKTKLFLSEKERATSNPNGSIWLEKCTPSSSSSWKLRLCTQNLCYFFRVCHGREDTWPQGWESDTRHIILKRESLSMCFLYQHQWVLPLVCNPVYSDSFREHPRSNYVHC